MLTTRHTAGIFNQIFVAFLQIILKENCVHVLFTIVSQFIKKINEGKDSQEEKELFIEVINSNVFVQLLNRLELKDIFELEKDLQTIIEILKYFEKLRMKENGEDSFIFDSVEKKNIKNKNNSEDSPGNKIISFSSSSNSLSIDIEEKNIFNEDIRRTFIIQGPKFYLSSQDLDLSQKYNNSLKGKNVSANYNKSIDKKKAYYKSKSFFNKKEIENLENNN